MRSLSLTTNVLPENEQENATHLERKIRELGSYVERFAAALALFDSCALELNELEQTFQK
jgi:ABC-type hemin transport system substrate-binding protein